MHEPRADNGPPRPSYTFYFFADGDGLVPNPSDTPSFEIVACRDDPDARSRALGLLWDHGGAHGVEVWQGERQVLRVIGDALQPDYASDEASGGGVLA
jgi:hypothetical protein